MSKQYPGGIISKTPVTPGGSYANSTAPGVWTLEQQAYWQKLGQWPTQGNYNPNAFIENLFSAYLTTGAGATVNVVNGIDLSTYGGLVWQKGRNGSATSHTLFDTARGINNGLFTNSTSAQSSSSNWFTAFNSNGFSFGTDNNLASSGQTGVNWTFRKQPKFFDVVTYTGNGVAGRTIAHNLGSVPGCIIVKNLTTSGTAWEVYHRSLGNTKIIELNSTAAAQVQNEWNNTDPTSTVFSVYSGYGTNFNGDQYVAYLFAHDAGGFGLTGTDNVITCGSWVGDGAAYGAEVNLGYEPQWLIQKDVTSGTEYWAVVDNMRGLAAETSGDSGDAILFPNATNAEINRGRINPTATGFIPRQLWNQSGHTYIYIAIRRGPMAVPTSGTSVFEPVAYSGNGASDRQITSPSFPTDLMIGMVQNQVQRKFFWDRLRGAANAVDSTTTDAEYSTGTALSLTSVQNGFLVTDNGASYTNTSGYSYDSLCFRRAPGFFDEVCYTGNGTTNNVSHNLGVAPELMIVKGRTVAFGWATYSAALGIGNYLVLNTTAASAADPGNVLWNNTVPTSSIFTVGSNSTVNKAADAYVAYLFATCAGVSKVGSYTGTATTLQVNCGFTGGARFVLIKRTDSTGDWYVWDSARGIVSGNDPYLLLNSTAAEVTSTDYVDTYSAGFEITSTAPAAINASGGTFIFLAIA